MNFKQQVFRKHGNLKKLSYEVEKLIRDAVVEDAVISEFEKIGVSTKVTITSQQIKSTRPKSRGPQSAEIIREMRRKRNSD
jgi:hypothetical protein